MEPEAQTIAASTMINGAPTAENVAVVSIAISLKRIADEVCGVPYDYAPGADNSKHHAGITAGIQMAIEQGIAAARRE